MLSFHGVLRAGSTATRDKLRKVQETKEPDISSYIGHPAWRHSAFSEGFPKDAESPEVNGEGGLSFDCSWDKSATLSEMRTYS